MSKLHAFDVGEKLPAEQWARAGKPEWADFIRVRFDRARALQLNRELADWLERSEGDRSEPFEIALHGALREGDE